jgi:hypothetical protein
VFGVLKSGTWGWVLPKSGAPTLWDVSLTAWLILAGGFLLWLFLEWEARQEAHGRDPLVRRTLFRVRQLRGGLRMFFFQYFVQSGVFFVALFCAGGIPKTQPKSAPTELILDPELT